MSLKPEPVRGNPLLEGTGYTVGDECGKAGVLSKPVFSVYQIVLKRDAKITKKYF